MTTIESVEPVVVRLPFRHGGGPTGFGGAVWRTLDYLLVRVRTSDGIVGHGEAFGYNAIPSTRTALETLVGPLAVGRADDDVVALVEGLERTLHLFGRSGPVRYALGGLEIALWDVAGKRAGRPVWSLLGAEPRESVDAYASAMPLGSTAAVAAEAERAVAGGLRGVKLHEHDPRDVAAAREAVGADAALMVDLNCSATRSEAAALGRRLVDLDLAWWEEPVWPPEDATALAAVRAQVPIRLAAGENAATVAEVEALAAPGVCDVVQPSVTKCGGIAAFRRLADAALARGAVLAPHSPYLGPGLLATLHLAAVHPGTRWVESLWAEPEARLFGDVGVPGEDGTVRIPSGPGLGADPDPDVVERFRAA